jgi:glycosyltransferase involved in cell wall biosynthesis
MKVLWFLPKWPFPSMDGATSAHMALLSKWPKNTQLDIVVYCDEEKTKNDIDDFKKAVGFNQILILPTNNKSRQRLLLAGLFEKAAMPTTVKKFVTYKAKELFTDWSSDKSWSHIIFDGIHTAGLFYQEGAFTFPKVNFICTRTHNVETELWAQVKARTKMPMKIIYALEEAKMVSFEKLLYEYSDVIVPVSETDSEKIKTILPTANIFPAAIGMQWLDHPVKNASKELTLLFIGRLDWLPNYEGLNWFLDEIWPFVLEKRKDISLEIVGGFASSALQAKIHSAKKTHFWGRVDDVATYYENSSITLIPIWTGSGTRVKAIEAAKFGRSFITTTKGIEGFGIAPERSYKQTDENNKWILFLSCVTSEECLNLGENLHRLAREKFDQNSIQEKFIECLKGLQK